MEKFIIMRCVLSEAHDSLTIVVTFTREYLLELLAGMDLAKEVHGRLPDLFALDVFHDQGEAIYTSAIWDEYEWTQDTPEILEVAAGAPPDPELDLLCILFQPDELAYTASRKDDPVTLHTEQLTREAVMAMLAQLGGEPVSVCRPNTTIFADLDMGEHFTFDEDVASFDPTMAGTWVKCSKLGYRSADPKREFLREIGRASCQVHRVPAS